MPRTKPRVPILQRGSPLARGLGGLWPVAEGAGSVLRDLSGRGLSLTAGGTPGWSAGPDGPVATFNGTTDYYTVDVGEQSPPFVLAADFLTTDASATQCPIGLYRGNSNNGFRLQLQGGTLHLLFGGIADYDTGLTLTSNVWHRAVVSCTGNGGTATAYLLVPGGSTRSTSFAVGTSDALLLGRFVMGRHDSSTAYFSGKIGISLWATRAWSAGEARSWLADPNAIISPPPGKKSFLPAAGVASFSAVASGSIATPTATASGGLVNRYPIIASGSLTSPTGVVTVGVVNRYPIVASSSLASPTATASAILRWTVVASSSLVAPSATATGGLVNVYTAVASGSLAAPTGVGNASLAWTVVASGSLASPAGTATVGIANSYPATASGSIPTPGATASAVMAWTVVASGTLAPPTGTASAGLTNTYPAVASGNVPGPTATATVTTAAVGNYAVVSSGTIPSPAATGSAGMANRYPVASTASLASPTGTATAVASDRFIVSASSSLASPTATASPDLLQHHAVLSSASLDTPSAVAAASWAEQVEFAATSSGSLASPSAVASVIVVASPSGLSFLRGSSGRPPGLRGYQR